MRRLAALLLLALPIAASAQIFRPRDDLHACDGEPARSTAIAATIGGVGLFAFAFLSDSNHRFGPSERGVYLWGVSAAALISGAVAHSMVSRRCPALLPLHDESRDCRAAAWAGSGRGAALGAVTAYVIAPIAMFPVFLGAAIGGRRIRAGPALAVASASGAAIGLPLGGLGSYRRCKGR
jgi:hypothetical protein